MSYFQHNQSVLEERFPHVAMKMYEIQQQEAQAVNNFLIEPIDKDHIWLEAVQGAVEHRKLILMYGFGQGFSLIDLLEMYPDRLVFVYEPDESSFLNSITQMDLQLLFRHPNFYGLAVGEAHRNVLFNKLCTYMDRELAFIALRHYLKDNIEVLTHLKKEFEHYSMVFDSNRATKHLFRRDWVRNSLYQISSMLSTPRLNDFIGALKGMTAVIVGSGPSLQQDIEWIEKMKPHALIIAAGSSIQALLKAGIQPHLSVLMDGGQINSTVFSAPESRQIPLFHTSSSYHEVTAAHESPIIHGIIKNDVLSQYIMGENGSDVIVLPTSTVVGTAIQVAAWLGAERIITMGQDLSFPDNKIYADGIEHVNDWYRNHTLKTAQHSVLNVHGTFNITNDNFLYMKDGLEKLITTFTNIEFINCTCNGAAIKGTRYVPVEEMFTLIQHGLMEEQAIPNLLTRKPYTVNPDKVARAHGKVELIFSDLKLVNDELVQLQRLIRKLEELSRTKPAKCQKSLELLEQKWGEIVTKEWFGPVLETLLPVEIGEFDRQLPSIVLERNLIEKSRLISTYLGEVVNRILEETHVLQEILQESSRRINTICL